MSAFPGVSSYQSSSLGSKFVVIGVVCCQEMRRNALFHKVLPVLTKYLKEILLPTLKPGDIVVMDNMRSHHVKAVREVLEEKGMKVLYLPPYSPDLNPIEKMWSKMKALLRGWKVRSLDLLPDAVRMALDSVSQLDCRHWFAASAYC